MIYTVTFNPSLDYVVKVPSFAVGAINRTAQEQIYPGGKGVNVSLVLQGLGFKSRLLGFVAGFSGAEIKRLTALAGCDSDFVELDNGYSRINMKISGTPETAVNGQGPYIGQRQLEQLAQKLDVLKEGDILVLSGSIPNSLPQDTYEQLLQRVDGKGVRTVVDATGQLVLKALKYRPFLIKPNHEELGEFFGLEPLRDTAAIIDCARKLQGQGARNVLVSRGGDGAVLLDEAGGVHISPSPKGVLVNSVGAGDSMVAGFLAGYLQSGDYGYALRLGICAGSASAFKDWLATKEDIESLLQSLEGGRQGNEGRTI